MMCSFLRTSRLLALGAVVALSTAPACAVVTSLTPDLISLNDTETTSFTDGNLTLTPFLGETPTTFNGNATRLGVDDAGTSNANAFNDPDTDPANGNEEILEFIFAPGIGLSQIAYDFARADGPGPNDGVFISGFLADPFVNFTLDDAPFTDARLTTSYDALTGTVELDIPGALFNGNDIQVNFGRVAASEGQTLSLVATDTTQAGAQFPITSISYDDDFDPLPLQGDVDGNGLVEIADFNVIRDNFYLEGATFAQGDLTFDERVTIADFEQWKNNFPGNGAAMLPLLFSAVPEPGSAALLLIASIAAIRHRQR